MKIEKISINNQDYKIGENGYKVTEVNVSYSAESLYAVCTPVKKQ